ncbi:MAG: TfoX/Sxy family protein [Chloroflexota bacterium]
MGAENDFVAYLLELLEDYPDVSAKRMFGGYGIFRDGLMFGLVADSILYLKVDDQNRHEFETRSLEPFTYEGKGKPMQMSYYQAPEEALDSAEEMLTWAESGYGAALRAKKTKVKKPKAKKSNN